MKKYLPQALSIFTYLLLIFTMNSIADQIHLKDGSVINGKVIQVTPKTIEFDPEGNRPFDVITRDQVIKIQYDDGSVVNLGVQTPSTFIDNNENNKEVSGETAPVENKEAAAVNKQLFDQEKGKGFFWYVGPEWGWNNYVGLGARFEFPAGDYFSLNFGTGLGMWGGIYRFSAGGRFYFSGYPFRSAIGLGVSYSLGYKDQKSDMEVTDSSGSTQTREMRVDYKPITVINITYLYSWNIYSDNKIYIEVGYGIRLSKAEDNYEIKDPNNPNAPVVLSQDEKDTMEFFQPGGVIIAVGMAF